MAFAKNVASYWYFPGRKVFRGLRISSDGEEFLGPFEIFDSGILLGRKSVSNFPENV